MQTKISIIIPCYNGEEYLWECFRSLMRQTLTNGVEYLFINDGSTDNTLNLLCEYTERFPELKSQIRIINNEKNLGISKTRKLGIKEAKGEYLAWVDCDDWIEPNMIEEFYKATDNGKIDIVVQNVFMNKFEEDKEMVSEWKLQKANSPYEALKLYYTDKYVPWGLPFQFSRKSLLEQCADKVYNVNYTEDAIMLLYLFTLAGSCVWLEKAYYHYRIIQNSNSLTHRSYKTREEWKLQKRNVEDVTSFILKKYPFTEILPTTHYVKWKWKTSFRIVFKNSWQFWSTFSDCYQSINIYKPDSQSKTWKTWLRYNIFILYWLLEGRHYFK